VHGCRVHGCSSDGDLADGDGAEIFLRSPRPVFVVDFDGADAVPGGVQRGVRRIACRWGSEEHSQRSAERLESGRRAVVDDRQRQILVACVHDLDGRPVRHYIITRLPNDSMS
jgi:hypothetical protein